MIVKNEEAVLARCLESCKSLADEIIIIDTGSTDATKEIAAQYTSKIFDFPWIDDFAAARNFSFAKASMEYCMWMDADDIITEKDQALIFDLKQHLVSTTDIVMMKYYTAFDEQHNPIFSYYRERLIKNNKRYLWEGPIHEVITPFGNIVYSDAAVTHSKIHPSDPDRNLRIFEKLLSEGKALDPRQQFYYGRELYYHRRYQDAIEVFTEFLDSKKGWLENNIDACKQMAYCYRELQNKQAALQALCKSFEYDVPRAEICCDIGAYFMEEKAYQTAIFWYTIAASSKRDDTRGGFIIPDCYNYIPYIQLCVCYDRLGFKESAQEFNEKAGAVKPNAPAYLANKEYFRAVLSNDSPS